MTHTDHPRIRSDSGHLLLNFGDYGQEVEVAAISGDGRRILTVREVDVARVWDAETSEQVARIHAESPLSGTEGAMPFRREPFAVFIESAALSHDGAYALLGLNDGTAVVYQVDGSTLLAVLHPPDEAPSTQWGVIRSVCYSTGDLAVVGFPKRRVGLWSTDGTERIAFLDPASDRRVGRPFVRDTLISSVDVSPDGRYVFAGASDMTAHIFDLETGSVVFEATEHAEEILALVDGPAGLGWATTGGSVWIRRPAGELEKCLETGEHWEEVAFDRDGDRLLARAGDGSVTLWSFDGDRERLFEPAAPVPNVRSVKSTLCLDGKLSHYCEGSRRVVVRNGGLTTAIDLDQHIGRVELTPQADAIVVDDWRGGIGMWDAATGEFLRSFPCEGGCGGFALSPDGSLIAIGELGQGGGRYPRHVYVYETATSRLRHTLSEHEWQIKAVAFSPDGRLLASLCDDLVVWRLEDAGRPLLRTRLFRLSGAFAFAGSELIAVQEGEVRVFAEGRERLSFEAPIGIQTPWTVSKDGRHLLVAGNQSVVRFQLQTGHFEEQIAADIPRPEKVPPDSLGVKPQMRGARGLWRSDYGHFLHQCDGPRGWVEPLRSSLGRVAVPCSSGAAVIDFTRDPAKLLGRVPFDGTLRAGHVVDGVSLMLNEKGQLFRSSL